MTRARPAPRSAGFSFMEILVVMGIIAVLVGLSVGIFKIVGKKGPEMKTRALLMKMRTNIDAWRGSFKAWPPSDLNKLRAVIGTPVTVGKAVPPNDQNWGIESLVQCLMMQGYDHNAELDDDLVNTDKDELDKAFAKNGIAALSEGKDAWGNPLVYFTDADYAQAEKNPPTYISGEDSNLHGDVFLPKPWRNENGAFAQQGAYQIFSVGEDGVPNTDDDLKAWTAN